MRRPKSERVIKKISVAVNQGWRLCEGLSSFSYLRIQSSGEELPDRERLDVDITSIGINTGTDPGALLLAEEEPRASLGVREVHEQPVAGNAQQACEEPLEDEDPTPPTEICNPIHLHNLKVVRELAG